MDDDTIDIALRSPAEVATRCIILGLLLKRIAIEQAAASGDRAEAEAEAFDIRAWLDTEGLGNAVSPTEAALLNQRVGQLSSEDAAALSWQAEALAALHWALDLTGPLAPAEPADAVDQLRSLPAPWDKTRSWLEARTLRPEAEIARARDIAELWHWRATLEPIRRLARGRDLLAIERAIAETAAEAQAAGYLPPGREADYSIGPVLLRRLSDDDLDHLIALTTERLLALNWLCGFGETWDSVPLDI